MIGCPETGSDKEIIDINPNSRKPKKTKAAFLSLDCNNTMDFSSTKNYYLIQVVSLGLG